MFFITLTFIIAACYFTCAHWFIYGINRLKKRSSNVSSQNESFVSVIVAARNEEKNIGKCLESLANQDFPFNHYEIIIVNDDSQDRTPEIVSDYVEKTGIVRLLTINERPPGLGGKQNALAHGIRIAKGELLLITDADCIVPYTWISSMIDSFDESLCMLGGPVLWDLGPSTLLSRLQALDVLYFLTIGAGAAGMNAAVSLIGNNIAIRKKDYEKTGGYESMEFTLTEDQLLVREVKRHCDKKIGFAWKPDALVQSYPEKTFKGLLEQRLRWITSSSSLGIEGTVLILIATVFKLSLIAACIALPFTPIPIFILGSAELLTSGIIIWKSGELLGRRSHLIYLPVLVIFQTVYQVIIIFYLIFRRKPINWKGRLYAPSSL